MRVKIHNAKHPLFIERILCQCQNCNGWYDDDALTDEICDGCRDSIDNEITIGYRRDE